MPAAIFTKMDQLPVDPGSFNTLISVWDPTATETVSPTGAVIRTPGGRGSVSGTAPLPGTPLWLDTVSVAYYGLTSLPDSGRSVSEKWAQLTLYFMVSKPYRAGMIIQIVRSGEIMEVMGQNNVDQYSRKQYLICKAVT